jgi:hypothetical protein
MTMKRNSKVRGVKAGGAGSGIDRTDSLKKAKLNVIRFLTGVQAGLFLYPTNE